MRNEVNEPQSLHGASPKQNKNKKFVVTAICGLYLSLAGVFSTTTLDIDEFTFIREPYEILGGDYTVGYLKLHEYIHALQTLARSYYFFWYYRPLNAPVIRQDDRSIFEEEEKKFGYVRPSAVAADDPAAIEKYRARLVVPEPDRFYSHGAGKPLLPALISIPQMASLKLLGITSEEFLAAQYHRRYSPIFSVFRLAQIGCGLASILLVFKILERNVSLQKAYLGATIFAIFPVTIKYFPNVHHDAVLVPFVLLTVYFESKGRYAKAGVSYGLALASKNLSVILLPAMAINLFISGMRIWKSQGLTDALVFLRPRLLGLGLMGGISFATLLPFANPISYAQEILTPVMSRPIDPRGENVSQWTVRGIVGDQSALSSQVKFAQRFLYFNDLGFFFFVLALCLAVQRPLSSTARLSVTIMVIYLPLSSIFGLSLGYRTLFLIPFFVLSATELLQVNQLKGLALATALLSMIYISNPSKTDLIHNYAYQNTGD